MDRGLDVDCHRVDNHKEVECPDCCPSLLAVHSFGSEHVVAGSAVVGCAMGRERSLSAAVQPGVSEYATGMGADGGVANRSSYSRSLLGLG